MFRKPNIVVKKFECSHCGVKNNTVNNPLMFVKFEDVEPILMCEVCYDESVAEWKEEARLDGESILIEKE